jgi:Mce-associated membrane protein
MTTTHNAHLAQEGGPSMEGAAATGEGAAPAEGAAAGEGAAEPVVPRWRRWTRAARPRGWRQVAATVAVVVLLLGSGGLLHAAQDLKDPAASGNRALTDSATTDQVVGDVSSTLTQIFGYTPDSTDATEKAARELLAGPAATQYQALFAQIKQNVAAQQLTLTTRVVRAGVVTLTATRARLLVFLDQTAQRAGATATTAAAQLSVTAEPRNGHWRITELTAR